MKKKAQPLTETVFALTYAEIREIVDCCCDNSLPNEERTTYIKAWLIDKITEGED